jgi:hypothetical protein
MCSLHECHAAHMSVSQVYLIYRTCATVTNLWTVISTVSINCSLQSPDRSQTDHRGHEYYFNCVSILFQLTGQQLCK